jgi:DNA-binding NarL/FixJ family response regulator
MAIRVTIFDDNKKLLDSLSVLIDGSPGFQMVKAYIDCSDLQNKIKESQPDVILMDIEMPGINGIEAVKIVKLNFPTINVLMQTAFEDDENVFAAICAGASGYILKNTPPVKILESIVDVYQGGSPMSPSVARKVLGFLQQPKQEKHIEENYNLTGREKEILTFLVKGMSYKMIAENCNISYETVRSHMKNIYEKLHVASMTEAVAKAINQKIVN